MANKKQTKTEQFQKMILRFIKKLEMCTHKLKKNFEKLVRIINEGEYQQHKKK